MAGTSTDYIDGFLFAGAVMPLCMLHYLYEQF
jgi:hypothetical protein